MLESSARTTEPFTGRRVSGEHPRRQGGLRLRGAGRGRHDPPGLPQHRAIDRAALRRAARSRAAQGDHDRDRYRQRRRHPQVLPLPADGRGLRRRPRGDRRMGADRIRLARAQPGLQGGVSRHTRCQRRLLRPLPGQRPALVSGGAGAGPVLEPRDHPPASRPEPAARGSQRRVHARRAGARRRHRRQRRQGRRHRVGAHPLQLHRPLRADPDPEEGVRDRLRGVDGHAGGEADLPSVVRDDGRGHGQPVRLSAVEPSRRERLDLHLRQGARAVGERVRLRRHRQGEQLLPPDRASSPASASTAASVSRSSSTSSAACC